jgi:serine O-acetyltransferase
MYKMLKLINSDRQQLLVYIERQLQHFFPDQERDMAAIMSRHVDEALARLQRCINAVKMWRLDEFDYLHSSQYTIFLYYLSNTIWKNERQQRLCAKLFYLNKTLNGIDLFYEIEMPEVFFIGHSVGIVLAKAHYSNYLVLYQNSTVGKNHGVAPRLGEGVIIYPNAAIIGGCDIANGSVIAQGVSVVNRNTPGNCLCFQGEAGELRFKRTERNILDDFFRFS